MPIVFILVSIFFWSIYYYFQYLYGEVSLVDFSVLDHMLKNTCDDRAFITPVPDSRAIVHSHLSIHINPLVSFFLPFRCLVSSPLILSFLQTLIFSSSFFILDKILILLKFSKVQRFFGNFCFLVFPFCFQAMAFNFHFEVFYLPLGFLFLYFYLQEKYQHLIITNFIMLMIKEDAAVYLTPFLIWQFIKNKNQTILVGIIANSIYLFLSLFLTAYFASPQMNIFQFLYSDNLIPVHVFFEYGGSKNLGTPFRYLFDHFVLFCKNFLFGIIKFYSYLLFIPLLMTPYLFFFLSFAFVHSLSTSAPMNHYEIYYSYPIIPFALTAFYVFVSKKRNKNILMFAPIMGSIMFFVFNKDFVLFSKEFNYVDSSKKINQYILNKKLEDQIFCVSKKFYPYLDYKIQHDVLDQYCFEKEEFGFIFHESEISQYKIDLSTLVRIESIPFILFHKKKASKKKREYLYWNFFTKGKLRYHFQGRRFKKIEVAARLISSHDGCDSFKMKSSHSNEKIFEICKKKERQFFDYHLESQKESGWIEIEFLDKYNSGDLYIDYFTF